ncbi:hypothetical protein EH165_12800 [Nakamurella antarctica]|uniref:Transposase n=1 Tax=Nakamurella antarctica TaxID=1902245 RepID=A0A3G8ZP34_9ACTN|nr:transposase [Nakamurella antarctica]AZI58888.1 hypothetical protein EH165_12800 [Nakamurella antarctica]
MGVDIDLAGLRACWEDVNMSNSRRVFTAEYRVEAAHRVIDSGRTIAETARELAVSEQLLGRWVKEERVRMAAATSLGEAPLDGAERTELIRLRRQVVEQEKDLSFLKKVSAYFAATQPK